MTLSLPGLCMEERGVLIREHRPASLPSSGLRLWRRVVPQSIKESQAYLALLMGKRGSQAGLPSAPPLDVFASLADPHHAACYPAFYASRTSF